MLGKSDFNDIFITRKYNQEEVSKLRSPQHYRPYFSNRGRTGHMDFPLIAHLPQWTK